MTTERIAQTFPDIASQGLSTQGTAAGVRSFPQPFIGGGAGGGVEVLIQNHMVTLGVGTLISSVTLGTPVDVGKSFIRYRGSNVLGSTEAINEWRTRHTLSSFVGSIASDVTVERTNSTVGLDVYFTVVTFTGAGGTSADIRIERGTITAIGPAGATILITPPLSDADFARAFIIFRGIEFQRQVPTPPSPCFAGTGIECQFAAEQGQGGVRAFTQVVAGVPISTQIQYTRFSGGFSGVIPPTDHCGRSDIAFHVTMVIFP